MAAGTLVAVCYYTDDLSSLGHALGPWVAIVYVVAARKSMGPAVISGVAVLCAGVFSFYIALKVVHDHVWADLGSSMSVNWSSIVVWSVLGVGAGAALGWLSFTSSSRDWLGPVSGGVVIGLILADAIERSVSTLDTLNAAAVVGGVCTVIVYVLTVSRNRRPFTTAVFSIALAPVCLLLLALPDLLQQSSL